MNSFERREGNTIVDIKEHIFDQMEAGNWDELELFVKEALTGVWINTYMSLTRKIWTQTSGKGSQNDEHLGYEVLANSVLRILESERKEREDWNREDPGEDDE
jgi:hypothetical protein